MSNVNSPNKGGKPRKYNSDDAKERMKLAKAKFYEGKKKFNAFLTEKDYERFIKLEKEGNFKTHTEFLTELLDIYESTKDLRKVLRKIQD
jgi:hypothetical protein